MTRHGYSLVLPSSPAVCGAPVVASKLAVTRRWARQCFLRAYHRARQVWGDDADAISAEIVAELAPDLPVVPRDGAHYELLRRIDAAVAALMNSDGVATPYPDDPVTPRPAALPEGPTWYRALMTGWVR